MVHFGTRVVPSGQRTWPLVPASDETWIRDPAATVWPGRQGCLNLNLRVSSTGSIKSPQLSTVALTVLDVFSGSDRDGVGTGRVELDDGRYTDGQGSGRNVHSPRDDGAGADDGTGADPG